MSTHPGSLDDQTLMAYADGELGAEEAQRVQQALQQDPELERRVLAFAQVRRDVAVAFEPLTEVEPNPDLVQLIQSQTKRPERRKGLGARLSWGGSAWRLSMASALCLSLLIWALWPTGEHRPPTLNAEIARALLSTPSGEVAALQQSAWVEILPLGSYSGEGGAWCRYYEWIDSGGGSGRGQACLQEGTWVSSAMAAGPAQPDAGIRPASGPGPESGRWMTPEQEAALLQP